MAGYGASDSLELEEMWTRQKRRSDRIRFIVPCLTLVVVGYFSYHIYHGAYGLYARANIMQQIELLEDELHHLRLKNSTLADRVSLLKNGSIEKDMLDEYARRNLNVARPNEVTIMLPREEG